MKNDSELISQHLLEIINERNLTINRVATLSGMGQSSVNAIFRGASASPKIGTLRKIAAGLNMPLTELLNFPPYNEVEK